MDQSGIEDLSALLTPEQVAKRWRVSVHTIRRRLNAGELGGFRIGDPARGQWRIASSDVEEFERSRRNREVPAETSASGPSDPLNL